jgi:hypothetical protein
MEAGGLRLAAPLDLEAEGEGLKRFRLDRDPLVAELAYQTLPGIGTVIARGVVRARDQVIFDRAGDWI